jgi:fructose-1,6-bisphosphatase
MGIDVVDESCGNFTVCTARTPGKSFDRHAAAPFILEVVPQAIHERVPVILGSPQVVDRVLEFLK